MSVLHSIVKGGLGRIVVLIQEIFLKRLATNRLLIARSRAAWDARDPEIYTIDVIAMRFRNTTRASGWR
jgi:hypothetical protein